MGTGRATEAAEQGTSPRGVHGAQPVTDLLDDLARGGEVLVELPEQRPVEGGRIPIADQAVVLGAAGAQGRCCDLCQLRQTGRREGQDRGDEAAAPGDLTGRPALHPPTMPRTLTCTTPSRRRGRGPAIAPFSAWRLKRWEDRIRWRTVGNKSLHGQRRPLASRCR